MKKIVSVVVAAMAASSCVFSASAADKTKGEPDVYVDGSKIVFADQRAQIVDDRTLVPARGVFEAMGYKVEWHEDTRTVKVTGSTGVRYVVITIDSDVMKIYTYKNIMNIDEREYKLDVPAQIMNDRTMIPLRAVSEAFDCVVDWDGDSYRVDITSGAPIYTEDVKSAATATPKPATSGGGSGTKADDEAEATEGESDKRPTMSLSTDKIGNVTAGEEFTVYIDVDNFLPEAKYLSGVIASFEYDKEKFEYIEGSGALLNDDDGLNENAETFENTEYDIGTRVVFVTTEQDGARTKPGHAFKATFKSLTGESGDISLNNDFLPVTGHNSYIMFYTAKNASNPDVEVEGGSLNMDNKVITIE